MRKLSITGFIVAILCIFMVLYVHATRYFWRGEFMSVEDACQRWGNQDLDIEEFRAADKVESERAKMICSLLINQQEYVGMDIREIRGLFGYPDGYYFSDMVFAYMIESAKTAGEDSWQIVFLADRRYEVSEIVVHKNCCYH